MKSRVAETQVEEYWVSTVRLRIDHGFGGAPLWFETMVFETKDATTDEVVSWLERYGDRYTTEDEARVGHEKAVTWVREQLPQLRAGQSQWDVEVSA